MVSGPFRRFAAVSTGSAGRDGRAEQLAHRGSRPRPRSAVGEGLVVGLDVVEVVAVVDHHAMRLRAGPAPTCRREVDALQPRAIAEMEARDRIDEARPLASRARSRYWAASGRAALSRRALRRVVVPDRLAERLQALARVLVAGELAGSAARSRAASGEARHRRERDEGVEPRQLALQVLGHLLDQEVAEGDAAQALLAVGDRVEHGRRRVLRPERPRARRRAASPMLRGCRAVSATSTKISGSSTSCGWKKAKQRRSAGSSRRRRSSQPWISCTAS